MKKMFVKVEGGSRGEVEGVEVVNMSYEEVVEWGLKKVGEVVEELEEEGDEVDEFMCVYGVEGVMVIVGLSEENSVGFYEVGDNNKLKELIENYDKMDMSEVWDILDEVEEKVEGLKKEFYFGEEF
jgi:hypothetical protein